MKSLKLFFLFIVLLPFTFQVAAQTTAYTTKTGKKYHRENCRYLSRSKIKTTIQKAKSFGYTACSVCKPVEVKGNKKIKAKSTNKVVIKKDTNHKKEKIATQCTFEIKSGVRCKRMTTHESGTCHQHRQGLQ